MEKYRSADKPGFYMVQHGNLLEVRQVKAL
jgi:hypothetical protein